MYAISQWRCGIFFLDWRGLAWIIWDGILSMSYCALDAAAVNSSIWHAPLVLVPFFLKNGYWLVIIIPGNLSWNTGYCMHCKQSGMIIYSDTSRNHITIKPSPNVTEQGILCLVDSPYNSTIILLCVWTLKILVHKNHTYVHVSFGVFFLNFFYRTAS